MVDHVLATRPTRVKAPRGGRVFEVVWGDGFVGKIPHELLRGYCPCAGCQGHAGTIKFVPGGDLELLNIETVGNYALQLTWGDQHGSGLYSFRYLRYLSELAAEPPAERGELPRLLVVSERAAIARRAGVVALGTLASRVLGLGRDVGLAALFTVAETDAFWVAFTIPNALRQLLAEGAVTSAVLPVLTKVQEHEGEAVAKLFYARIRGISLAALALVSVLGVVFAPQLVALFAGGFAERPGEIERTVTLTRWVFPYIFFMGSAALGMAALHTHRRFVVASFAPGLLNVAFIAGALLLPDRFAAMGIDRSLALAVAALVGGALQVLAQLPSLRAVGYAGLPKFSLADPHVREVLKRMGPMTLGLGIYYVDLVVCRRLLSGCGEGAQSYFAWAQRLCDFPQGIFVMALSAATLPSLATFEAKGDRAELGRTVAHGVGLSLFVALPVTAAFASLGEPIVVAFFQRGHFDAHAASETAKALAAQGAGVWTVAVVRQLVPAFFAIGNTRTPVIVSAIDLVALIIIAFLLKGPLGHVGVSWAVAGSSFVQMALLAWLLVKQLPTVKEGVLASAGKTALASAFAAIGAAGTASILRPFSAGNAFARLVPASVGGLVFGAIFLAIAWGVNSPELRMLSGAIARRLRRKAEKRATEAS